MSILLASFEAEQLPYFLVKGTVVRKPMHLAPKDIRQIRDIALDAIRGVSAVLIESASRTPAGAPESPEATVSSPMPREASSSDASRRQPEPRLAYTIKDAGHALSLGRSTIYKLIGSGELPTVRIGSRTLIPAHAIEALVARR